MYFLWASNIQDINQCRSSGVNSETTTDFKNVKAASVPKVSKIALHL